MRNWSPIWFVKLVMVHRLLIVALLAAAACGEAADSTEPNVSPPIGTVTTGQTEPLTPYAPSTSYHDDVEAATTGAEQPSTLTLHVSNQSFADDPVGITISLDGETVVDDNFYVDSQHNWGTFELAVSPGDHELVMTSSTGVTQATSLSIPAEGHRWAVVSYWSSPEDPDHPGTGQTPRRFTVTVYDEPVSFA